MKKEQTLDVGKKLTFIIPVKIDNRDRIDNLKVILNFISKNFRNSEIVVLEQDAKSKLDDVKELFDNVIFEFTLNENRFSKSKAINDAALLATRKYLVIYDLDILVEPEAILEAIELMDRRNIFVMLPHNSIFVNVADPLKKKFVQETDFSILPKAKKLPFEYDTDEIKAYKIPSGIVIFERNAFFVAGGYNRNMVSYGWEDIEILKRMASLGYYYYYLGKYNLYHLDHKRGQDSKPNELTKLNKQIFDNVIRMSYREILKYTLEELAITPGFSIEKRQSILRKINRTNILRFQKVSFLFNKFGNHVKTSKINKLLK